MNTEDIRTSIQALAGHFAEHPTAATRADKPATATLVEGLKCRAEGANGAALLTDMPQPIGGGASAPTPGWFLRAALASCDATVIAMRAAQLGISLTRLEVTVGSESDSRGLLGTLESAPPGPLSVQVSVRIAASNASPELLREVVHWAERHSPVNDALQRAVPVQMHVCIEE